MNTKIYKIGLMGFMGLMGLTGVTGCSDFLEIKPQNEIILEDFWNEKISWRSNLRMRSFWRISGMRRPMWKPSLQAATLVYSQKAPSSA